MIMNKRRGKMDAVDCDDLLPSNDVADAAPLRRIDKIPTDKALSQFRNLEAFEILRSSFSSSEEHMSNDKEVVGSNPTGPWTMNWTLY